MKYHTIHRIATSLITIVAMLSCIPAAPAAVLTNLRCEYRDNPLGIDAQKPRLSWVIEERGQRSAVSLATGGPGSVRAAADTEVGPPDGTEHAKPMVSQISGRRLEDVSIVKSVACSSEPGKSS